MHDDPGAQPVTLRLDISAASFEDARTAALDALTEAQAWACSETRAGEGVTALGTRWSLEMA